MTDVFVSYSRENRAAVAMLVEKLRQAGMDVWWDDSIEVGSMFDRNIEQKLRVAACAVVVWSSHAIVSDWVRAEAALAFDQKKLIPVTLQRAIRIPLPFNLIHALDLQGWSGDEAHPAFQELVATMSNRISSQAGSVEPVPAVAKAADKTTVAVLPFESLIGQEGHDAFGVGLAASIIASLSKFSSLQVLSRRSSFDPRLTDWNVAALGQLLGADYLVQGILQRDGNDIVVTVELTLVTTGFVRWSNRFSVPEDDLDRVQFDIARQITRDLGGAFVELGSSGSAAADDSHLSTQSHLLYEARGLLLRATAEGVNQADVLLQELLAAGDPPAAILALQASVIAEKTVLGLPLDAASHELAITRAHQAITKAPADADVHKYCGYALAVCGEHGESLPVLRRACELNSDDIGALGYLGWTLAPSTDPTHGEEILSILHTLLLENPRHPGRAYWLLHQATALTCAEDFIAAEESIRASLLMNSDNPIAWLTGLNAIAVSGRPVDEYLSRCRLDIRSYAAIMVDRLEGLSRDSDAFERRTRGLRMAGIA